MRISVSRLKRLIREAAFDSPDEELRHMSYREFREEFPEEYAAWTAFVRARLVLPQRDPAATSGHVATRLGHSRYAETPGGELTVTDTKDDVTYIWTRDDGWVPLDEY